MSPSVSPPGYISFPKVTSKSLVKLVSRSSKKKKKGYSTITPLWSCYRLCPNLKFPSLLRAKPEPSGLLWLRYSPAAPTIFNQGTWPQNSLIESVQESTPNPCSSEGRVNWEWTHWKKPTEEMTKLTSYNGATLLQLGSCNVKLDPSAENIPQPLYRLSWW